MSGGRGGVNGGQKDELLCFRQIVVQRKKRGCSLQAFYVQDCMEIEPKRWFTCTQLAPHLWIS